MINLTKDTLFLIFLKLNDSDLVSLCKTNKYFKEQLYKSNVWKYKLEELKEYSKDIQELRKEVDVPRNPRELYQLVQSLINVKKVFTTKWSLSELYNKELIIFSNGEINKIPNLSLFKKLKTLILFGNKIEKIPETLPDSLQGLNLSSNKIKKIPKTLPNSLQKLYLASNKIEKIPDTLPDSLEVLDLRNNKIENIPDTLPDSLTILYEKIEVGYLQYLYLNFVNLFNWLE
jgi:Leucine-rich repeat (LRR) protein